MLPQPDEFHTNDAYNVRVSGQYDKDGYFLVDPAERSVKGRCDKAGYLIDRAGNRMIDFQIKDRIRKRSYPSEQPDEFYRIDADGNKVFGHYDDDGHFIVKVDQRGVKGRCDKDGYMLEPTGRRVSDDVIRDRRRVRYQLHPRQDEMCAIDAQNKQVSGRYNR